MLIRLVLWRFAWTLLTPLAALLAFIGLSWLIDLLDRLGVLDD